MTNLDKALVLRAGSAVPAELVKLIKLEAEGTTYEQLLATSAGLSVGYTTIGGRRQKHVLAEHGGRQVPITKAKLYGRRSLPKPCKHCGKQCNRKASIKACRDAIGEQIQAFKAELRPMQQRCAISNCPLALCPGGFHIDHIVPFSKLLADFCALHAVDLCSLRLAGRGQSKLLPTAVLELWQLYHLEHATLQAICKKQNLSKGKK